jgi:hypothetical protein
MPVPNWMGDVQIGADDSGQPFAFSSATAMVMRSRRRPMSASVSVPDVLASAVRLARTARPAG